MLAGKFAGRLADRFDETRINMARPNALVSLSVLGLLTGLLAGGVIVLFRWTVEGAQQLIFSTGQAGDFESLNVSSRILLPIAAAFLLAGMFRWFSRGIRVLGIAHVLERMDLHQGRIRWRAFFLQFAGAALAIVGGHSVGREGPMVFLGAATGSLLGTRMILPYNVIRTLVGCGTAAGIAASFNTPLAGVIFALEVVMMEYTVNSFIPVILAAVSATALSNAVFGDFAVFGQIDATLHSLWHLVPIVVLGITAGAVSAAFIQTTQMVTSRTVAWPIEIRLVLAGAAMAAFGSLVPEVMGLGYDSMDVALHGGYGVSFLLLILVTKLFATSGVIGLGVPGGTIGPTLFMGAMLGALFGSLAGYLPLTPENQIGLFALLGMGAMMAGILQAPLAALAAMLELTDYPGIIMPGMLVVVISGLTASEVFGKQSQFITMLKATGLRIGADPVALALRRIGVASVMDRRLVQSSKNLTLGAAHHLLHSKSGFVLVQGKHSSQLLLPVNPLKEALGALDQSDPTQPVDLLLLSETQLRAATIGMTASLQEAAETLERKGIEALVVKRRTASGTHRVYGVLTRDMIDRAYRN